MEDRESFFTTHTFKFRVEGQQFFVPGGLISRFSPPLDRLINLDMREKKQRYAVLEDVTAATFDRFLEWACKGFYTPPGPFSVTILEDGENGHMSKEANEDTASKTSANASYEKTSQNFYDNYGNFLGRIHNNGNNTSIEYSSGSVQGTASHSRQDLRQSFYSRKPDIRGDTNTAPPRKNHEASENYTNIFLCHAQLYVFADAQDIQPLKLLALDELHAVLAIFELHPERTGDIVELLRYVYANTASPSEGEEPLKKVVADYVGFEMDVLMNDEDFSALMIADGGDMLRDYMSSVSKRIKA